MADGMINIIENKVLLNLASHKIEYSGPIVDKIKNVGSEAIDTKNWEFVNKETYDSSSKIKQAIKKIKSLQTNAGLTLSQIKVPLSKYQPDIGQLEIVGFPANIRLERQMDRKYMKVKATICI